MRNSKLGKRVGASGASTVPVKRATPNPSIERTSNIRLRLLLDAAHVER